MNLDADSAKKLEQCRETLPLASYEKALEIYKSIRLGGYLDYIPFIAALCQFDRFFFLTQILRGEYALHPWVYARCREVEADSDDHLDLWARGHFKSTLITFAGSLQEIVKNPEITVGIFSNDRPTAKKFLQQIARECEDNELLHKYWPEIFWENPRKEAPKWSLDEGLHLKRKGNPREPTIGAYGLVDAQPTGSHFGLRIYDDVVTEDSVGTPDMITKTTERWELSQNLAVLDVTGDNPARQWHVGTRYHYADTYGVILQRKALKVRVYPATDDGTYDGKPVLMTDEAWEKKKRSESRYTIACQQLLNPLAGEYQEFKLEWLRKYEIRPETLNVAILVDPAHSKKKEACNTAFSVIGMDAARNKYLLDGACHKMSLTERWIMLKNLWLKWVNQKGIQSVMVGYERYGLQADVEHFNAMMEIERISFPIQEVAWTYAGSEAKDDRIRRLVPDHQNWRFFYPHEGEQTKLQAETIDRKKGYLVAKPIKRRNEEGRLYNLVEYLINNEYLFFPATTKKDLMDAMSRVYDVKLGPPMFVREEDLIPEHVGVD